MKGNRSMATSRAISLQTVPPLPAASTAQPRPAVALWAAGLLSLPDVVFLDTETTGLDGRAEIVEIAVLDVSGAVLLETLVRPSGQIPREVIAIHGITDDLVAGAPRWPEVYPLLTQVLAERTIVVYNAAFDERILAQTNARHGLPPAASGWHCAMQGYAAWAGQRHARYGGFRWHKLDVALAAFGHTPAPDAHRARADADACRLVMHGMAQSSRR